MAGWGSGGSKLDLPPAPTPYTAQVADVEVKRQADYNDKSKEVERFKFSVDVWINGAWARRTLWTGTNFSDPKDLSDPQFVPKLMKLVRACGLPFPANAQEAAAWDPNNCLIGKRFGILCQPDPESGVVQTKFVPLANGQAIGAHVAATPPPAAPAANGAPPPPAANGAPPDPFTGDAGATAPTPEQMATAQQVAGGADPWA